MTYNTFSTQLRRAIAWGVSSEERAALHRQWLRIKKATPSHLWPVVTSELAKLGECPLVHLNVSAWSDGFINVIGLDGCSDRTLHYRDAEIPASEFENFVGDCIGWDDETDGRSNTAKFEAGQPVIVSMVPNVWALWLDAYEAPSVDGETLEDIFESVRSLGGA